MEQVGKQYEQRSPIVLIVDDNPAIRNVISWSLKLGGYEPIEAATGWEAVTWMEQAACDQRYPALILLDLGMPGMNGESFLQWLQTGWPTHYPTPSIVIITAGYADERMLGTHVKEVVIKPFHTRELVEVIRKWVAV